MGMRIASAGVTLILLAAGAWALSGPCGWLDLGGGCLGRQSLRHIAVTGDTFATDAEGRLLIVGIHYRPDRRDRLRPEMVLVTLDPESGKEIARADLAMLGQPDQMRLSPTGDRVAISCNALYICDLPGGNQPDQSWVMVFDREGQRQWFGGIEDRDAPPDADGRAFDLAFSPSGGVVFAHVAFDAATGDVILTKQQPLQGPTASPRSTDTPLDLPEGFVPFPRLGTALSPDGSRIAVLARRFSGPGEIRAAIRIHDTATGALVARHDLREDLAPAILWHPSRDAVIVALAAPARVDAGTELRFYAASGGGK